MALRPDYNFVFYLAIVFILIFMTLLQVKIAKRKDVPYAFIVPFATSLIAFIMLRDFLAFFVSTFFIFGYFLLLYFILRSKSKETRYEKTRVDVKDL